MIERLRLWVLKLRNAYASLDPAAVERGRWVIFLATCLVAVGLVWVESASYPRASAPGGAIDAFAVFKRQFLMAIGGLGAMIVFACLPLRSWLAGLSVGLLAISTAWMAAAAAFGTPRHGTKAWLIIQPSEFAKVFLVVFGAWVLSRRPVRSVVQKHVMMYLAAAGVVGALLVAQRDMGMLVLVGLSTAAVLFIAGVPLLELAAMGTVGLAGFAYMLMHSPVRLGRIIGWLWPEEHLDGAGYHVVGSLIAVARGQGVGLLPGGSPDKWVGLPYPATDSIFCIIAAESGLWGTALLLVAFGALLVTAMLAAHSAESEFDRITALGCGMLIAIQVCVHTGVAVNLLPATGMTLPFISAGGSSLIASCIAAGIIANVARRGVVRGVSYAVA